jgi:hypothetical protein
LVSAALAAACGSSEGPGSGFDPSAPDGSSNGGDFDGGFGFDDGGLEVIDLKFDPPSAALTVDGVNPKTASFTLKATFAGGRVEDVSPQAVQFDRPDIAKVAAGNPSTLTAAGAIGGVGKLRGIFGGKEATATLSVSVQMQEVGPGVSQNIVTALMAAGLPQDPSLSSLLYPYDKTVFPLGLTSPLLMWNAPASGDVYRIHFDEPMYTYDGFFVVSAPAQVRVSQAIWDRVTASNGGAGPLNLAVYRWSVATGTAYASAKQSWTIAPASLRGAIYYWTTSGTGHMAVIRPGTGSAPQVLNGGKCMGCHAVSADGSTLVAAVEGQVTNDGSNDNRAWVTFDLPAGTQKIASTYFAGNVAVNPNGKYVVFGDRQLKLGDTATGQRIMTSGIETLLPGGGTSGFMTPAFAPGGRLLAAVQGTRNPGAWYHNLMDGNLVTVEFDPNSQTFSNKKDLAAASAFPVGQRAIAYPTFSPDSQWIAFHVGDYATGCDSQGCNDAAAQLGQIWLQNVSGAAPVRLDQLNDSSPLAADHNRTYEPTFNPIERGGYHWVVVTSSRDWGNALTGTPNNGKKRLWVAAIDKAGGTTDPSHPAFYLEGQENTTNMRGFWALAACTPTKGGGACQAGFECCSGFCDQGVCVDTGTIACKGVGEQCVADADCCNGPQVKCVAGVCKADTPR